MLCGGDGQPYKQNWHRDWQGWDPLENGGEEGSFGANGKHVEWKDAGCTLVQTPSPMEDLSVLDEHCVLMSGGHLFQAQRATAASHFHTPVPPGA